MFNHRKNNARPSSELLERFRTQYPEISSPGSSEPIRLSPGYSNREARLLQVLPRAVAPAHPGPAPAFKTASAPAPVSAVVQRNVTTQQPYPTRPAKRQRTMAGSSPQAPAPVVPYVPPQKDDAQQRLVCPFPSSKSSCMTQHEYLTKLVQHLIRDHHFFTGPTNGKRRRWLALFNVDAPPEKPVGPIFCLGCNSAIENVPLFRYHEGRCVRDKKSFAYTWEAMQKVFMDLAPRGSESMSPQPLAEGTKPAATREETPKHTDGATAKESATLPPVSTIDHFASTGREVTKLKAEADLYKSLFLELFALFKSTADAAPQGYGPKMESALQEFARYSSDLIAEALNPEILKSSARLELRPQQGGPVTTTPADDDRKDI